MRLALTAMLTLLLHRTAGAGEIHRWTDSEGRVYFGDRPPVTVGSEIVRLHINTCSSPGIESLAMDFGAGDRVVMYSARWCGVCQRAKRHFEANGSPSPGTTWRPARRADAITGNPARAACRSCWSASNA
jgi:hypothetical protein